jgi:hypothetical protein
MMLIAIAAFVVVGDVLAEYVLDLNNRAHPSTGVCL